MRTPTESELTPLRISGVLEQPREFPNPFDEIGPHPVAALAAHQLQQSLRVDDSAEGKVLGVLVVKTAQGLAYLKAFSGKWQAGWLAPGFAPPLFDIEARARLDAASDAVVKPLHEKVQALEQSPGLISARATLEALQRRHEAELRELKARHEANREQRAVLRSNGTSHEADHLSRADTAEKRRLAQRQLEEHELAARELRAFEQRVNAAKKLLSQASARMVRQIIELPRVPNARGETCGVSALFEKEAPGGAGECAAPKLLARAYALGLEPVALAEFWWGPTQASGRVRGAHVPACKAKCGPLLPFMLQGLEVGVARRVVTRLAREAPLRVVYEDQQLRVIEKPEGLLSISGREASHVDAVETRMPGTWVVHRLDLDTSGLLILALDAQTHVALQQQFARREVLKRYVAVVEGLVEGERGTIELALRPDVDDRPRQIHDAARGKEAVTNWELISREATRSRLALNPLTGRTHQLRVHCAHELGLGAPIVGDRLYGRPAERLLLHCERLELTHPTTGQRLVLEAKAPF